MAWMPYTASSAIAAVASCAPEALWQLWDSMEPQQLNHGASELRAGCTKGAFETILCVKPDELQRHLV